MRFIVTGVLLLSLNGYAQPETSKPKSEASVETMVKKAKRDRRKKVEMCHDCGKPEVNCDCPEEVRKKEQEAKKAQQNG